MSRNSYIVLITVFLVSLRPPVGLGVLEAQPKGFNYDEARVPKFELPQTMMTKDGRTISTPDQWRELRRPELLQLFAEHVYGHRPPETGFEASYDVKTGTAYDGLAKRKLLTITLRRGNVTHEIPVLIYLPANANRPVPVFMGLNFHGNHTVTPDPQVPVTKSWVRKNSGKGTEGNKATEKGRGTSASRWPIPMILQNGFAIATIYYGEIDPDYDDGFQNGIHALFPEQSPRDKSAGGSISAWSWGLSRLVDYLETDRDLNHQQIALIGHSRLGKTSLWAGATDERIALVISNNSGCGGAALSRREFGETVKRINTSFPHWFCKRFRDYNDRVNALPVDQHQLMALIAPRPLYVASAAEDLWADPQGEFLSAKHASEVYELLGVAGLPAKTRPPLNEASQGGIGYHIRRGKHDVTDYDWQQYLKFASKHFGESAAN